MKLNRYTQFIFESLILESIIVYSDKFKKLLKEIDSPVAKSLLNLENQDLDVANNFIDIHDKDQISFIQDRKAKELEKNSENFAIYNGEDRFLKHSEGNAGIFQLLEYEPVGEKCYHPNVGEQGQILKKVKSPISDNTYLKIQFEGGLTVINEKSIKYPDPKELAFKQNRQTIRIGRGIKGILQKDKSLKFTDAEIEQFVNKYKSEWDKMNDIFRKFEVVSGDEIVKWYDYSNYEGGGRSTLGQSCMRDVPSSYFDIYVRNSEKCRMVILKGEDESKIKGRAIIWNLDSPKGPAGDIIFMDRIYYNYDSDMGLFREYALKNGWFYKSYNGSSNEREMIGTDGEFEAGDLVVNLKNQAEGKYRNFPYLDTLKYFDPQTGKLTTNSAGSGRHGRVYTLEDTGGWWIEREENCDVCDGEGSVECPECYGDGTENCGTCWSRSSRSSTGMEECGNCNGSGEVDCSECNGTGEIDGESCSRCSGSGNIECGECSGSGDVECGECNGSGSVECGVCNGGGRVDCPECQ